MQRNAAKLFTWQAIKSAAKVHLISIEIDKIKRETRIKRPRIQRPFLFAGGEIFSSSGIPQPEGGICERNCSR
jgi:hypothetical protein